MIAPLSGQSLGLQRAQVTSAIRQVSVILNVYFYVVTMTNVYSCIPYICAVANDIVTVMLKEQVVSKVFTLYIRTISFKKLNIK